MTIKRANIKFGLVCPTMCQGLTMHPEDIYSTQEAAEKEHADMIEARRASGGYEDEDDIQDTGFEVMKIVQQADGSWTDDAGEAITLMEVSE